MAAHDFFLSLLIILLTATSIGITVRVLGDLKRQHSKEGQIVLGAAVLDDVMSPEVVLKVRESPACCTGARGGAGCQWVV